MEKVVASLLEEDYERLVVLSKSPANDEDTMGFKALMSIAKSFQTVGCRVLVWENLDWENTAGSSFIEGFLSFCPQYRFITIDVAKGELLRDSAGYANGPKMNTSVSIRVDVKINV